MALSLAFALLLAVLSTTSGITASLSEKASVYFAGDLSIQNFFGDRLLDSPDELATLLATSRLFQTLSSRSEYLQGDATLFFGGSSVRQRRVSGIEPTNEVSLSDAQDYVEGAPLRPDDLQGLVISRATATRLHVRAGDEIVLLLGSATGQKITVNLVVRGVLNDSSLFSYACYLNYQTMNEALNRPVSARTTVGGTVSSTVSLQEAATRLQSVLAKIGPVYPPIRNRDELQAAINTGGSGSRLAIVTLDANLAQVTGILNALTTIALATVILFTFIVTVGVGNTYRMIFVERTREIGTMRALGLSRGRTAGLFLWEAFCLGLVSSAIGLFSGLALLQGLSLWDFSAFNLAQVFLVGGHLKPKIGGSELILAGAVLLLSSVVAVLDSAIRAANLLPAEGLRWE